jgi:branched-chain amino acid transport system ATP-binding protein
VSAATADPPVLDVRGLHVHRGGAHVLQGVDLTVAPRRVTALLGRNGAGKTTTLLALLGLLPATGSVRFDGEEILGRRTHTLIERGIAYVPEDREVFTQLSVAENLSLAARTPQARSRLDLVHELFPDLEERRRQRAGTLSGGQQQMLALARALLNPTRLILVDEPSKGLAPKLVTAVVEALERVAQDTTILLVEQNLRVAQRLAADAVVLDHGTVAWSGPMAGLFEDTALTQRHLGVSGTRPSATTTPGGDS